MPTTPILQLPWPTPTDPADVPTDMGELANRIESALVPRYGTSLPANPADAQEAILVDSLTNPSYQWRFRYNAGSSSPYKWEFVGGGIRTDFEATQVTVAPGATNYMGPQITVPRPGEYNLRALGQVYSPGTPGYATVSWSYYPSGTTITDSVLVAMAGAVTGLSHTFHMEQRITLATGLGTVVLKWVNDPSGQTVNTLNRTHTIEPVRIS